MNDLERRKNKEKELEMGFYDDLTPGHSTFVNTYEFGTDRILNSYNVVEAGDWEEVSDSIQRRRVLLSGGLEFFVEKDTLNQRIKIMDKDGGPVLALENVDVEIVCYGIPDKEDMEEEALPVRPVEEMKEIMEGKEKRKKNFSGFTDENGNKICEITYDSKDGNTIFTIDTEPYANVGQEAEHNEEHVYVTDEEGGITPERLTRKEARDLGKRYMIVSCLLFHGNEVLLQKRSSSKKLDPDKLSTSAHGVAKEIQTRRWPSRVPHEATVALVNMAMEINEELRHGEDEKPFHIIVWPGSAEELINYAHSEKINDPDTIYLVSEAYYSDDGYALGNKKNPRTRALFSGFVFSEEKPRITPDPGEVSGVEWTKMSRYTAVSYTHLRAHET